MAKEEQKTGQQSTAQPSGKAGQQTAGEQTSQSAAAKREPEQRGQGMQPHRTGQWLSPLDEMERALERMFERVFPRGWMRPWRMESPLFEQMAPALEIRAPRLDVIDRENELVLRAEIPGVKKEDLDVSIKDGILEVKLPKTEQSKRRKIPIEEEA